MNSINIINKINVFNIYNINIDINIKFLIKDERQYCTCTRRRAIAFAIISLISTAAAAADRNNVCRNVQV